MQLPKSNVGRRGKGSMVNNMATVECIIMKKILIIFLFFPLYVPFNKCF